MLDNEGVERHRLEGYLPADDFLAQLELGLGKLHFQHGRYEEARRQFETIADEYGKASAAPEAVYWAGVSDYKATNDPSHLARTARTLKSRYPESEWTRKASVWSQ